MRHIDDGYSYDFYEYARGVLDYYRKKSDYDIDESERAYREKRYKKLRVLDDEPEFAEDDDTEISLSFGIF